MTQERFEQLEAEYQKWQQETGAEIKEEYDYFGDDFYE